MAKIQVRIDGRELQEKLPEFSGQKINIVKKDGAVSFIRFDSIGSDSVKGTNLRLSKVSIPLEKIREVIIDIKAKNAH